MMSTRSFHLPLLFIAFLLIALPAKAQSDIAISVLASFSSTTEGVYTHQNPFDQAGCPASVPPHLEPALRL